jgi:hypothetical protein
MSGSPREDGRRRAEDRAAPSWVGPAPEPRSGGLVTPAPDDGVQASSHPPGPIGAAWARLLERAPGEGKERVVRGRGLARRGRVRGLTIAPGCASAEVVAEGVARATVRVRAFEPAEWDRGVAAMREDLSVLGALLEGELSVSFLRRLAADGINVIPTWSEMQPDCDCGDYVMPCAHVGAVLNVLVDALDGDPFLLLTLRGRTRDQLLSVVRQGLGMGEAGAVVRVDEQPVQAARGGREGGDWAADWLTAPSALPEFGCALPERVVVAAGLRAMGPPPGDGELLAVLTPLYEAGGAAVRAVIEAAADGARPRRRLPRAPEPPAVDPTELLVDALAELDEAAPEALARRVGWPVARVREELAALEALGIVVIVDGVWRLG